MNIHFPFLVYFYSLMNNSDRSARKIVLASKEEFQQYQKIYFYLYDYPYELISRKIPEDLLVKDYSRYNKQLFKGINKNSKLLFVCCAGDTSYMQMQYMRMHGFKNVWYSGLDGALLDGSYYIDFTEIVNSHYAEVFNFERDYLDYSRVFNGANVHNLSFNNEAFYRKTFDPVFLKDYARKLANLMSDRTKKYLLFGYSAKFFIKDIREKTGNSNIVFSEIYASKLDDNFVRKYFSNSFYENNINNNIKKYEKNNDYKNLLSYLDKIIIIELKEEDINCEFVNELYYKKYLLYKKLDENKKAIDQLKELISKNIADQYITYLIEEPQNKVISRAKFYKLKGCYYDKVSNLPSTKVIKQYKNLISMGFYEKQIYKKISKEYIEIGNYKKALIFINKYLSQQNLTTNDLLDANIIRYKVFLNNMTNRSSINPYSYFFETNYIDDSKVRKAILAEIYKINDLKKRLLLINLFIETADSYKKILLSEQLFLMKLVILNDLGRYEEVIRLIDKSYKQEYRLAYTRAYVGVLRKLFEEKEYLKVVNIIDSKIRFFDLVFLDDLYCIVLNIFKSETRPEFIVKYYDILIDNYYLKEKMLLPEFIKLYSNAVIRVMDDALTSETNNDVTLLFDDFLEKKYLTNDLRYQIYIKQYFYYKDILKDKKKALGSASAALRFCPNDKYALSLKDNIYRKTLKVKDQKRKDDIVKRAKIKERKKHIKGAIKLYKKALLVDDSDRELYKNILGLSIQDNSILHNERILDNWLEKNQKDEVFDFYPYGIKLQILYDKHSIHEYKKLLADLADNKKFIENKEQIDEWYYYLDRDLLKNDIKVIEYINKHKNSMRYDFIYRKKLSFRDEYLINKLCMKLNKTKNLNCKIRYVNEILKIDPTNDDMGLLLANMYFKNKEYSKALQASSDFIVFLEKYKLYKSSFYINNIYVYKAINDYDQMNNMKKILLRKKDFIEPLSDSQIKFIKNY